MNFKQVLIKKFNKLTVLDEGRTYIHFRDENRNQYKIYNYDLNKFKLFKLVNGYHIDVPTLTLKQVIAQIEKTLLDLSGE